MYFRGDNKRDLNESNFSRNKESLNNSMDRHLPQDNYNNKYSYQSPSDYKIASLSGHLDEQEALRYNSSGEEDEMMSAQKKSTLNIEDMQKEVPPLQSLKTNTLTSSNTATNSDFKDFNKTAEDLNNRIRKLLNKNN